MGHLRFGVAVVLAACGTGGQAGPIDAPVGSGIDAAPAPFCHPTAGTHLKLVEVASGLRKPVGLVAPSGDGRLFVLEQEGAIRIVKDGVLLTTPFLDLRDQVNSTGLEQGLLGLAFHPRFADNGRFYVFYTRGTRGDVRIAGFRAAPGADVADPTETIVLDDPRPGGDNEIGGTLLFGLDGKLYISMGDGGGAANYTGSGQNPQTLHAKILRIDVDAGEPYAIPADNPWAAGGGVPEMFAWGLRNPWRIAMDPATGDLYIGDVGEADYEEIDLVPAGARGRNFGWAVLEGPACFTLDPGGDSGCSDTSQLTPPLYTIDRHRPGNEEGTIVGGAVYRGTCMPDLVGRYFFGDYNAGRVHSLRVAGGVATDVVNHSPDVDPDGRLLYLTGLSSFGVDGYGELYLMAVLSGRVYRFEVR